VILFLYRVKYCAVRASRSVKSCADNTAVKLFALTNIISSKVVGTENGSLCKTCRQC